MKNQIALLGAARASTIVDWHNTGVTLLLSDRSHAGPIKAELTGVAGAKMSTLNRADLRPDASVLRAAAEDHSQRHQTLNVIYEVCGRGALLAFFAFLAHGKTLDLWVLITHWDQLGADKYLDLAATFASLAF